MRIIEISIENNAYSTQFPKELEEYLAMASVVPISVTVDNKDFVLVSQEDFDHMMCDEDMPSSDTEEEENHWDFKNYPEEEDFTLPYTPEEIGDSVVSLVLGILERHKLNSTQLCHLEEVVSAMGVIATAQEVYRGEI